MRDDALLAWLKISLSFLAALLLTILPIARPWVWLQPAWVLLVLVYWVFAAPQRIGLIWVWCIGLYMDLLTESPLGQHTIPLLIVAYFLFRFHARLTIFPFARQYVMITGLIILYYGIEYWLISLSLQTSVWVLPAILPIITSSLLWLFVYKLLENHPFHSHKVRF